MKRRYHSFELTANHPTNSRLVFSIKYKIVHFKVKEVLSESKAL